MSKSPIVLIHGAFVDSSIWRPVYDHLARDGDTVLAPQIPLRGLPYDVSYTESLIDQIDGPVVLVGHSYGGAVITVAGSSDKVAGLVYVAGVVPDEGESVNDLQGRFPSLAMGPLVRPTALRDGTVEASIDPARFPDVFGADLPADDAAFRAISITPWRPRRSTILAYSRSLLARKAVLCACATPPADPSPVAPRRFTASPTTVPVRRFDRVWTCALSHLCSMLSQPEVPVAECPSATSGHLPTG